MLEKIPFQIFSDLNSLGSLFLLLFTIFVLVLYFTNQKIKNLINQISYHNFILIISVILAIGVISANLYEFVYNDPPCMFCWYQRIFIYGMLIVALSELYFKTKKAHIFISIFAILNLLIATYHYSFHFKRYVLNYSDIQMPCSLNPLLASCESAKVVSFGFMTMPAMSIITSLFVLSIIYLIYKSKN